MQVKEGGAQTLLPLTFNDNKIIIFCLVLVLLEFLFINFNISFISDVIIGDMDLI